MVEQGGITRRRRRAQELEIYCYLVAEIQGTLATPDPSHPLLPHSITSSKVLQGLIDRFPGVTLHMRTHMHAGAQDYALDCALDWGALVAGPAGL